MAKTFVIDPVTRLEGHLSVRIEVADGKVTEAYCQGEMFRGFEQILRGRHPMDAQQITQRICGVCPISHGIASVLAQDAAYKVSPPPNGRLLRNLVQAANYIQSHIVHFYLLSALDFVDITAVLKYTGDSPVMADLRGWVERQLKEKLIYPAAPFLPRYEGKYLADDAANFMAIRHYVEALEMRQTAHQMVSLFGAKVPHSTALVPGGITEKVTARAIVAYKSKLEKLRTFIRDAYLPDVVRVAQAMPDYFEIGKGCGNFLAYGVFPESDAPDDAFFPSGVLTKGQLQPLSTAKVAEHLKFSKFDARASGRHPYQGETIAQPAKEGAYTWLKAPRYDGQVMEVGPLARMLIAYHSGKHPEIVKSVDALLAAVGGKPEHLDSVLGRHAARALECQIVADKCLDWLAELKPRESSFNEFELPQTGEGAGLTEAPRGALGHWLVLEEKRIKSYQCIVPTTWNCSPRDDKGVPGALEQAIAGTRVESPENPIEVARVVRSFDPCLACAVH
ncbi:MAG: nickel-dependent hydrogenase large subunit [Magnetococcales bacterium]|nr:nickel-dependent hydrogenase large subunit [Magnetococcales bacterium]MBF0155736.1 nickel-dependent hydrogenase large subunit [Magnetococcales bacterium]